MLVLKLKFAKFSGIKGSQYSGFGYQNATTIITKRIKHSLLKNSNQLPNSQ